MVLRKKLCERSNFNGKLLYTFSRYFSSNKMDLRKLKPMIQKRIQDRAKDYPVPDMIPVAQEVLNSRRLIMQGVSTLLKVLPVMACKFCPEIYIGEKGHLIQTCCGFKHRDKNRVHEWITGGLNDVLAPVEAFHLKHMFQDVIKHHQRFDFERVPAVVELCWQAGANDENRYSNWSPESDCCSVDGAESLSSDELLMIASGTLRAWESLRNGVEKLLMVYPAKLAGNPLWRKANVDDLMPPKIVWRRRPQDPQVLLNEGRGFYGHAPAVVELCTQAGAVAPSKYHSVDETAGCSYTWKSKSPSERSNVNAVNSEREIEAPQKLPYHLILVPETHCNHQMNDEGTQIWAPNEMARFAPFTWSMKELRKWVALLLWTQKQDTQWKE
ncbi:APO protein 4 mitochondrial [Prunus yedoensis var. nudiflora]|uniref:APO protein 4 mitochondrial n=1 Tax=Prunus yedoensis var. nudiflora TaxID=2094558 RepID=A0A314YU33_PRUYE|nr:APO protein 4 mitochondrial [Prunus yedoensis var. nudiflora]